jgi:hypothetical protein
MSYQPDCEVDEIYEPEVPPQSPVAETPSISTSPSAIPITSNSNVRGMMGGVAFIIASVFVL